MPLLPQPDYIPAFPFTSGHVQTLYPTLFRRPPETEPERRRIDTGDGDFLDIDWHYYNGRGATDRLAVISHGLEGDSRRKNVLGMAAALTGEGWDVLCFNFRGCSGELNRLPRLYHSGVTDDLHTVLFHGLKTGRYNHAVLVGFSMGGNQTLKYLGENPAKVPKAVKAAAVFSVPVDLADSARTMAHWSNRIYMEYFLHGLRDKIRRKARLFPDLYDTAGIGKIKTFFEFDDRYTGPIHGFKGAADYYARCSAGQFLKNIEVPALLIQAGDDPFLPPSCYPEEEARSNKNLFLEIPRYGGHVGFIANGKKNRYWHEDRALLFIRNTVGKSVRS